MWIVTYKGKPVTLSKIYQLENKAEAISRNLSYVEEKSAVCCKTKSFTIALYLHHIGFTWRERFEGIEVQKV